MGKGQGWGKPQCRYGAEKEVQRTVREAIPTAFDSGLVR